MKQRTLKEVAQAGLVLGFEWIAKDGDGGIFFFDSPNPKFGPLECWYNGGMFSQVRKTIEITDYPHVPEKSLLKLSEIVEVG